MAWRKLAECSCCEGCASLDGAACARHTLRRMCDGWCKDFEPAPAYLQGVLTEEEQARCRRLAAHPAARFPLLTRAEMRHLLWFHTYFGDREHQSTSPVDASDIPYPDAA